MKENSEIRFPCTTEEHDKLKQRAKACGMSLKNYILYVCLNSKIKIVFE